MSTLSKTPVGRALERQWFHEFLSGEGGQALYLHGVSGMGKTTLLHEWRRMAAEKGFGTVHLDMRFLPPRPEALEPLIPAMGSQVVVFVDTLEKAEGLEAWLRESLLPRLQPQGFLCVASQNPLPLRWRTCLRAGHCTRVYSLGGLENAAALDHLQQMGLTFFQAQDLLELTRGHPLSLNLALLCHTRAEGGEGRKLTWEKALGLQLLPQLLASFVEGTPSAAARLALWTASVARTLTPALWQKVAEETAGEGVSFTQWDLEMSWEWLVGLPFVEGDGKAVWLHDLVRDVAAAHLAATNPRLKLALHRSLRGVYLKALTQKKSPEKNLVDLVFLHRQHRSLDAFFHFDADAGLWTRPLQEADAAELRQGIVSHMSASTVQAFEYWWLHAKSSFLGFFAEGRLKGFLLTLGAEEIRTWGAADPETEPLLGHMPQGEGAVRVYRLWLDLEQGQGVSTVQSRMMVEMVLGYLMTENLCRSWFYCEDGAFWNGPMRYARLVPVSGVALGKGGLFTHDWKHEPVGEWLEALAGQEMSNIGPEAVPPEEPQAPQWAQAEWIQRVRVSLRNLQRPDALKGQGLLESEVLCQKLSQRHPRAPLEESLRLFLKHLLERMEKHPQDERAAQALIWAYFRGPLTIERAAEHMGASIGSFRRWLTHGYNRLAALVEWEVERKEPGNGQN